MFSKNLHEICSEEFDLYIDQKLLHFTVCTQISATYHCSVGGSIVELCEIRSGRDHLDWDQKIKLSRGRHRNKNVQLFNIQNSITFHKSTVIANDVIFLHKLCNFSR